MTSNGGSPPCSNRDCFEEILFVLITGIRWKDLPTHYPSKSVCYERYKQWSDAGLFQVAWKRLLDLEKSMKQLDLQTVIGDGTFVPAKKGRGLGPTMAGKRSMVMLLTDAEGVPLHLNCRLCVAA